MKHIKLFENWGVKEESQFMYDIDNLADPSEDSLPTYAKDFDEETPEEEEADFKAEYDPYDYEAEEAEESESEEE
jgi:hypothetical protein